MLCSGQEESHVHLWRWGYSQLHLTLELSLGRLPEEHLGTVIERKGNKCWIIKKKYWEEFLHSCKVPGTEYLLSKFLLNDFKNHGIHYTLARPSFSDVLTNGKLILVVVYITTTLPFSLVNKTWFGRGLHTSGKMMFGTQPDWSRLMGLKLLLAAQKHLEGSFRHRLLASAETMF